MMLTDQECAALLRAAAYFGPRRLAKIGRASPERVRERERLKKRRQRARARMEAARAGPRPHSLPR